MDALGFFDLVRTPSKFAAGIRRRLDQLEKLVKRALQDLGVAEVDTAMVQQRVWQLLARLSVLMPRLESPNETDWSAVGNSLIQVARGSDRTGASRLRDRLVALASEYSPKSARVDLTLLRRDAHAMLDPTMRRHQQGWQALHHLHSRALASVRAEITASYGSRSVRLERSVAAARLVATATDVAGGRRKRGVWCRQECTCVTGPVTAIDISEPTTLQVLCVNLRQVPQAHGRVRGRIGLPARRASL